MIRRFALIIGFIGAGIALFMFVQRDGAPIVNDERYIVVVIPSYNNSKWYDLNISSVLSQKYNNYHVIYIDDCSPDKTGDLVTEFVEKQGKKDRVTVIKNDVRHGALYNLYHTIHSCDDRAIIATLDGDDWFKDDQVLKEVNRAYSDNNVLMTYGQFEEYPEGKRGYCRPLPSYFVSFANYRKQPWFTSHLRTFRAGLFKRIKKEDLQLNGEFYSVTWDLAMMFPMLEMANGRVKFIDKVLYVYNIANPINDFKVRLQLQNYCERIIRQKQQYQPLDAATASVLCAS